MNRWPPEHLTEGSVFGKEHWTHTHLTVDIFVHDFGPLRIKKGRERERECVGGCVEKSHLTLYWLFMQVCDANPTLS